MTPLYSPQIEQKTIVRDLLQHLEAMSAGLSAQGDREGTEHLKYLAKSIREPESTANAISSAICTQRIQYDILSQLIKEVIIERAIGNIDCTREEKALAHELFIQQQISCDRVKTLEELESLLIRSLKIEKFIRANWEDQIDAYFLEQKDCLDRVSFSLICLWDFNVAQEIYFRLQEGEQSFAELARQYSFGVEAQTGGKIDFTPLSDVHPTIVEILRVSQPGQLCFPVPVEEWFAIVRMEQFFPACLDFKMRRRLLEQLFDRWLEQQVQQVYELL